jgi:hypothetical protein
MRGRLSLGLLAGLSLLVAACGAPAADGPARGGGAATSDRPVGVGAAADTGDRPAPAQAGSSPAIGRGPARAACPTTRPPDPPFVPPAPYPRRPPPLYGEMVWYGTDHLWTWLDTDGTWAMAGGPGGVQFDKSFWWRQGYDWQQETSPPLQLTGRRLDAPAPPVTSSGATNGFREDIGAFMLVGLELPAEGCWEITGHYAGRSLRFVVLVT